MGNKEVKEFLVKSKSLTGLVKWMNENEDFNKSSNTPFTVSDIQSYVKRGYLPEYLGKNTIERNEKIQDTRLYNIVKTEIDAKSN